MVLSPITCPPTLENTNFFPLEVDVTIFALYLKFTQKIVFTTKKRPTTPEKTNFLPLGVKMIIFTLYLKFTRKVVLTTLTRPPTLEKTDFFPLRVLGCDPFNRNFRKFRSKSEWIG